MASQLKTNVRTLFGIFEMVLFSGVVFGWANLVLILKEEEYFKDLCAESQTNSSLPKTSSDDSQKCDEQDERLALIFTLSVFAFNVAGFIGGTLLDKLGTRFVRLVACFFYILTGIFAFLLEKDAANLMFPLLICLAFAGMFVTVTDFQIAVSHPKHRFIVSSSLSGSLDASAVVFLIFKVLYDTGLPLRWILVGYVILAIVCTTFSTFILLPKISIAAEQEEMNDELQINNTVDIQEMAIQSVGYVREFDDISKQQALEQTENTSVKEKSSKELGINNHATTPDTADQERRENRSEQSTLEESGKQKFPPAKCDIELGISNQGMTADTDGNQEMMPRENGKSKENGSVPELQTESQRVDKYSSGWRYILTGRYLWLLYFFSLIKLRLWFFVGSLNGYLIYHTDDDKDKIETYSEIFGLTQFFGFFLAPITGIVMNLQPRNIANTYFGPMMSFILTMLFCVILGILVLLPVLEIQYLTFIVQVTMRAFLYASLISFVLRAFPVEHYGKLYGVCTVVGATVSLLQYPAIVIIDGPGNGNPYWVNFGFLIATFTAIGFPIHLWRTNRITEEVTSF